MANIIEWQTDESESNDPGPAGAEPQDQDDSELEDDVLRSGVFFTQKK